MRSCILTASALLAALSLSPSQAQVVQLGSQASAGRTTTSLVPKQLLPHLVVALQPGVDVALFASDWGTSCVNTLGFGGSYELLNPAAASPRGTKSLLGGMSLDPRTRFVELATPTRVPETSTCLTTGSLSGLPCTISFYDGDPAPTKYYNQPLTPIIDLAQAQSYLPGDASIVAVIDTGVDATHPLLAGHVLASGYDFLLDQVGAVDAPDGVDNDHDGLTDEATGHGTHIAGTIVLINPDALILPLRVLDSDGNGDAFDVADAIYYAVAQGAHVINLSLGMNTSSAVVAEALDFAASMEVEVYAAAGNTGKLGVQFPASYPTVLAVTAVDALDVKADFATFGPGVGVAAPGVDIYSSMPGNAWAWWSGTSMSCAVASGVASMLTSIEGHSGEGPGEIYDNSAPISAQNPGFANLLGSGRVDAGATVLDVVD